MSRYTVEYRRELPPGQQYELKHGDAHVGLYASPDIAYQAALALADDDKADIVAIKRCQKCRKEIASPALAFREPERCERCGDVG